MAVSSAPDGGWGWVVCCACFLSHVLTHGFIYSFGVVYVELLDYFQKSKSETAIIASLAPTVLLLSGPVVAVLVNKFGCRIMTISGAFVASVSQFVSIFAPNIQYLYGTLGVMTGLGYGLIYLPAIVAVSQNFTKRRAFATGLGVSGSGIGTFILSPILNRLIQVYAWQGAIMIVSGLVLNCIACGLVYRPISLNISRQNTSKPEAANTEPINAISESDDKVKSFNQQLDVNKQTNAIQNTNEIVFDVANSLPLATFPDESIYHADTLSKTDDNMHITIEHIPNNRMDQKNAVDLGEVQTKGKTVNKHSICELIQKAVSKYYNMDIFKSTPIRVFLISTFFFNLGYYVPYVYLPDTAREAGIDELSASWLISSVGVTDTVGRVIFGFLSDRKGINRRILYNTSLVICGLATTVVPLLKQFWALLLYTMVFGFSSGVTASLVPVILADSVGIERFADAFGMNNFSAGVAAFAGPPLAGGLFDISGSYVVSYICAGVSISLSGAMLYFVPFCSTT